MVRQRCEVLLRLAECLCVDCVCEALAGDQEVDEVAVEAIGNPSECAQLDGFFHLTALELMDPLVADSYAFRKFHACHSQGVANGPNPSSVRPWFGYQRPEGAQASIQVSSGLSSVYSHRESIAIYTLQNNSLAAS